MSWAAARVSRSFGYFFGAWLISTLCLTVGLATVAIEHVAANQFKIANVDIAELAGPASVPSGDGNPAPVAVDLTDRFGAPTTYGATEWTVVGSRLIAGADNETLRPIVVTEVVVANSSPDSATRVRASDVALSWPDGELHELDRFEFIDDQGVFSLDPGESLLVTLVFKPNVVVSPDLAELNLVVGEHGRVPALLPIQGDAPEPEPSLVREIDGQRIAVISGGQSGSPAGGEIVIVADRLTLGLNAGHYRASVGQRILAIDASIVGSLDESIAQGAEPYLDSSFWRLSVDGEAIDPLRVQSVDGGGARLLFAIDAGPQDIILSSGTSSADEFRSSVVLPDPAD